MENYEKIKIIELRPGMKVAEKVENQFGAVLVSPGTILTRKLIGKLSIAGAETVTVYKGENEKTKTELENRLKEINYEKKVDKMKNVFSDIKRTNRVNEDEVKKTVNDLMEIDSNLDIMDLLSNVRSKDDYTYTHSVNVGLMAMMFGGWLDLEEKEIKKLTYAGFLHDIGKAKIPNEILNKNGPLTNKEFEIVKKHSIESYKIIKDNILISEKTAQAVLLHHERKDGSGYPMGLKGDEIPLFAKILGIVDTFDAMTSDRAYKQHQVPFDVLKMLSEESFQSFDITLLDTFTKNIANYYQGEEVILSNDDIGELVFIDPNKPTSPIVKVDDRFIDLRKSDIYIKDLVTEND